MPVYAIGTESKDSIWVCTILTKKRRSLIFECWAVFSAKVEIFAEAGGNEWCKTGRLNIQIEIKSFDKKQGIYPP